MSKEQLIARRINQEEQTLQEHLLGVSIIAAKLAAKMQLTATGQLMGLLHDLGKASEYFQQYIRLVTDNPDVDDAAEQTEQAKSLKGKIDHSTAGAQWAFRELQKIAPEREQGCLYGQIVAVGIASHHSGLIDIVDTSGTDVFAQRMAKSDQLTHLSECENKLADDILPNAQQLLPQVVQELRSSFQTLCKDTKIRLEIEFYLGCLTKFLFSCLIDADRINSADFDKVFQREQRRFSLRPNWQQAIDALEVKLNSWKAVKPIDHIRRQISDDCLARANDVQGIYTLTVPTGGGKTLAGLRYALHHAQKHQLERIIFIIPYTSIIEQNAAVVRDILGDDWVLEQHSNLQPEQENWKNKLAAENWDKPIVFTTMVQFLEAWFGSGTRSARHIHPMAKSVLIFDEVQTVPVRCVHLFCNVLNFLHQYAGSTAVLCTATQPLLGQLTYPEKGQLHLTKTPEIMGESAKLNTLFDHLSRVNVEYCPKAGGWSLAQSGEFLLQQFEQTHSCLMIVNTKRWAQDLYHFCRQHHVEQDALFHLSTNMCAAHRKVIFAKIRTRLQEKLPVLCVSTQLIEAGVDISFSCVIRALAGLDSIAQAAGRCNRHGENQEKGHVFVINLQNEPLQVLPDIRQGQAAAERVFREFSGQDILQPKAITQYFQYYFYERSNEMDYRVSNSTSGTLLDWLSHQSQNKCEKVNRQRFMQGKFPLLQQSFRSAAQAFAAIDAPTRAVIVPYAEGAALIAQLCGEYDAKVFYETLRKAQAFSVNIFDTEWKKLEKQQALCPIADTGIYYVKERFYSDEYGLTANESNDMTFYSF